MVRTEVKISMKMKYSACLYFKLLKSYPNNTYTTKKRQKNKKTKKKQRKKKLRTAIEWDYGIVPSSSIKGLPTDKNV
jgi:hypothetical protein